MEIRVGNFIDLFEQLERFDDCDVPPKLSALAKNHTNVFCVVAAIVVRNEAVGNNAPSRRRQYPGEDFNRGGLPRPIGSDITSNNRNS